MERIKSTKPLFKIIVLCAALLIGLGISFISLSRPVDRNDHEKIEVEIKSGTSKKQIGTILKEKKLIRSETLFKLYVYTNSVNSLKADTYAFERSMSLREIVNTLESGSKYNPDMVKLTFKEGLRITDYAKLIDKNTNNNYDNIISKFKDREYAKTLISKYWFLTDKILDSNIYYPLEGYLAPDTYHFDNKNVKVEEIITTMLDETNKKIEKYKSTMSKDPHYYFTMASIVELEGTNTTNRKMIVGVFKNRLSSGYNMGSDVTTYYALQKDMTRDLKTEEFLTNNPYNTRAVNMVGKMPIGPICSSSVSSIEASTNPTKNNYLFFVADKKGNIFYTKTNAEHDKKVAEIKEKGDWIW